MWRLGGLCNTVTPNPGCTLKPPRSFKNKKQNILPPLPLTLDQLPWTSAGVVPGILLFLKVLQVMVGGMGLQRPTRRCLGMMGVFMTLTVERAS